jgi:hypothetical protein
MKLAASRRRSQTMEVIPFLDYLSEDSATGELAASLAQVFQLRGHAELVPTRLTRTELSQVAS